MSTAPHGQRKQHRCRYGKGCTAMATCLPRLYIPCYQINSFRTIEPMTITLGLYLCDDCFKKLKAQDVLQGERGIQLRESATIFFTQSHTRPNFDKAVIGRVATRDHDFGRIEDMEARRAN